MLKSDESIFNYACKSEADCAVDGEWEEDDDVFDEAVSMAISNVCSRCTRCGGDAGSDDHGPADWETLDNGEGEVGEKETIGELLKHLGNVKKQRMSIHILKDLLGSDASESLEGIKAEHDNCTRREERKIRMICSCC